MLELEVVTPKRRMFRVFCDAVTLPGQMGEFEVLEGHLPLLAGLKTGVMTIRRHQDKSDKEWPIQNQNEVRLMIGFGFAEVGNKQVKVLCEVAALPHEVDAENERKYVSLLQSRLQNIHEDSLEFKEVTAELECSTTKLMIV